jgi:8-oxo-dGTP pyrophosphatase MutT (NUDIX family)
MPPATAVRAAHLKVHPGQISFPGGHVEPHDNDVAATAVRETAEELGIPADAVEVLGSLAPNITVTGYRVVPVLGLLGPGLTYAPDELEVAEVFDVPLGHLFAPGNRRRESRQLDGREFRYDVIDYGQRRIWGATANIVVSLNDALSRRAQFEQLTPFLDAG